MRRSKIYYLSDLKGKSARIKEKRTAVAAGKTPARTSRARKAKAEAPATSEAPAEA